MRCGDSTGGGRRSAKSISGSCLCSVTMTAMTNTTNTAPPSAAGMMYCRLSLATAGRGRSAAPTTTLISSAVPTNNRRIAICRPPLHTTPLTSSSARPRRPLPRAPDMGPIRRLGLSRFALRDAIGAPYVRPRTTHDPPGTDALHPQALERVANRRGLESERLANDHERKRRARPAAAHPVFGFGSELRHRTEIAADAVLEHGEKKPLDPSEDTVARLAPADDPLEISPQIQMIVAHIELVRGSEHAAGALVNRFAPCSKTCNFRQLTQRNANGLDASDAT